MRNLPALLVLVSLFTACADKEKMKAPPAPRSIADVSAAIKGKNFTVKKLGTLSPFEMDSLEPVNWNIEKEDTSRFFRDYADKQRRFTLHFSSDTIVRFFDTDNTNEVNGTYSVDDDPATGYDTQKPGIKIRVKYADSLDLGGMKTPSILTYSFLVTGLNDKDLILETSREINSRKLVVWMSGQ